MAALDCVVARLENIGQRSVGLGLGCDALLKL